MVHVSDCCPKEDFEALREEDPKMYSDWCQYKENASNTAACIRGVLLTAINTLMTDGICNMMAKEQQLDFCSLVRQKTVLFIVTSPVNPALHPFANLVFGSMFKELFEYAEELPNGRLPIPLSAICDDFATGGQIPNFQHHISIFREKGIAVMMLVQSLSQLAAMYGNNGAITIRDNTDNIVYMGGNDLETADQIARRINKPVDEVLSLPIGQEYLFRRGQKPLQLQRYQIYDDPLYRQEILPNDETRLK
jgi:type IV secretory pathway TraG/TraD family ATPase VirD4